MIAWGNPADPLQAKRVGAAAVIPFVLLLAGLWVVIDHRPPSPVSADAAATEFSAARAFEHLKAFAVEPHFEGQADHSRVRDYLVGELEVLGIDTHVQAANMWIRPVYRNIVERRPREFRHPTLYNVMGRIPGTDSTGALLFASHYDSTSKAPGATDAGLQTAAILEMARAIVAGPPLRNDVILALTDAEESGLRGARAFVAEHPWADDVGMVFNFDGGGRGTAGVAEISHGNAAMISTYRRVVPKPMGSSSLAAISDAYQKQGLGGSDFLEFRELGKPGFFIANALETGPRHTPADGLDVVSLGTVQHYGGTMLALAREYGERDLATVGGDSDLVWVQAFTWLIVAWPAGVAWVQLAFILAAFGLLVVVARSRGLARLRGMLLGAGMAVLSVLFAAVTGTLGLGAIQIIRPDYRPYLNGVIPTTELPGLGLTNDWPLWWGLLLITAAVTIAVLGRARRRATATELTIGTAAILVLMAGFSTYGLVGTSYLFNVPALFLLTAALVWITVFDTEAGWRAVAVLTAGAVPTVLLLTDLLVTLQAFTIASVAIAALFVGLFTAQFVPQMEVLSTADRRAPVLVPAGVGLLLVIIGLIVVDPNPLILMKTFEGPRADEIVDTAPFDEFPMNPWVINTINFASGRSCLEAATTEQSITWCPLPASVALPIDVQHATSYDGRDAIVFGGVADGVATVIVEHPEGSIEIVPTRVPGIRGLVFSAVLPAAVDRISTIVTLDAQLAEIARRPGFDLVRD